jgi:hypothetical protein
MTLVDVFSAYVTAIHAVVTTAHVWWPALLGGASLGWGVRRAPRRGRHRRTRRPDTSGQGADICPDLAAPAPTWQP